MFIMWLFVLRHIFILEFVNTIEIKFCVGIVIETDNLKNSSEDVENKHKMSDSAFRNEKY